MIIKFFNYIQQSLNFQTLKIGPLRQIGPGGYKCWASAAQTVSYV